MFNHYGYSKYHKISPEQAVFSNLRMSLNDLADCAICCKATAVFERSMGPDFHQETLRTVNLAAFPHEETVDSSHQSYQGCFDTLINQYIKTGQTTLNAKQLTRFMQRFNARCVESIKKST